MPTSRQTTHLLNTFSMGVKGTDTRQALKISAKRQGDQPTPPFCPSDFPNQAL